MSVTRRLRVEGVIQRRGVTVRLDFKPAQAAAPEDDDWPDPDAVPIESAPASKLVKVFIWSGLSEEVNSQFRSRESVSNTSSIRDPGVVPAEYATAVFSSALDLNTVQYVHWQGADYRILYSDMYEFEDEKLAQQAVLIRARPGELMPHA